MKFAVLFLLLGLLAGARLLDLFRADNTPRASGIDEDPTINVRSDAIRVTFDKCVVSGKELGSMGPVYAVNHFGVTVRFCCHKCLRKFADNTEFYLSKLLAEARADGSPPSWQIIDSQQDPSASRRPPFLEPVATMAWRYL